MQGVSKNEPLKGDRLSLGGFTELLPTKTSGLTGEISLLVDNYWLNVLFLHNKGITRLYVSTRSLPGRAEI